MFVDGPLASTNVAQLVDLQHSSGPRSGRGSKTNGCSTARPGGSWYRHPFLFFPPTDLVSTLPECVDSPTLVYEFVQPYEIGQCGQVQHAEINR